MFTKGKCYYRERQKISWSEAKTYGKPAAFNKNSIEWPQENTSDRDMSGDFSFYTRYKDNGLVFMIEITHYFELRTVTS